MVELATRQRGRVTRQQLLAAGITKMGIEERVSRGQLTREHHGVYVVGHLAAVPWGKEAGALLAAGAGACLSYRTGVFLWAMSDVPLVDAVELTIPTHRRVERPGLIVHRADVERTRHHGLPVTTPMQTLNDVAPTSTAWELERFIAEAHGRKLLDASQASTRVRAAIDGGINITRSKAEQLLLKLVRRAGLPEPETNAELGPWTIDALWRPQRVAVEIDSWAWHGTRRSFERDRRKDRALRAAGLTPVRITARQLQDEEIAVAADLGATLARAA